MLPSCVSNRRKPLQEGRAVKDRPPRSGRNARPREGPRGAPRALTSTHIQKLKAPLLLIQGASDPRVPVGEAIQMHDALEKRGVPTKMMVFPDEGHGTQKRENKVLEIGHPLAFFEMGDRRQATGTERGTRSASLGLSLPANLDPCVCARIVVVRGSGRPRSHVGRGRRRLLPRRSRRPERRRPPGCGRGHDSGRRKRCAARRRERGGRRRRRRRHRREAHDALRAGRRAHTLRRLRRRDRWRLERRLAVPTERRSRSTPPTGSPRRARSASRSRRATAARPGRSPTTPSRSTSGTSTSKPRCARARRRAEVSSS